MPVVSASLKEKIQNRTALVGIIGMGYVGLPLACEFAKGGFNVTGIDINQEKVDKLNQGTSYILDVDSSELTLYVDRGILSATSNPSVLEKMDCIIICVPTPLRKTKDPNISYIYTASESVAKHLKQEQIIILQSITYPGTTEELLMPMFEELGFKAGKDFYLAFSPERVDPGNKKYTTGNTPKIVGGVTKLCTELAALLFNQVIDQVVLVETPREAEMVKLLENTFRSINIGLVNELAMMSDRMGIDIWRVVDAAATKPFGFMPFYPGPGLGGHCIPIDPFYLSWKAKTFDFFTKLIELAGEINGNMPRFVVHKLQDILNDRSKPLKGSTIFVLGVSYKRDISDLRESPALEVIKLLASKGAIIKYNDPFVPSFNLDGTVLESTSLELPDMEQSDCIVIATNHSVYDYTDIVRRAPVVFDTRNATRNVTESREKIVKL